MENEQYEKYIHLSNSGLTVTAKKDLENQYPTASVDIEISTFGCMNSKINLINTGYCEQFMTSNQILELAQFFAIAAKMACEVEAERANRNLAMVEGWIKDKPEIDYSRQLAEAKEELSQEAKEKREFFIEYIKTLDKSINEYFNSKLSKHSYFRDEKASGSNQTSS